MDTDSIWKFMRFNTIREYCDRTPLPAPFCLISHLYLLLQQFSRKCCKQRGNKINSLSKLGWKKKVIENSFSWVFFFFYFLFYKHAQICKRFLVLIFNWHIPLVHFEKIVAVLASIWKLDLLSLCIYQKRIWSNTPDSRKNPFLKCYCFKDIKLQSNICQ